jgi:hypothetical protein
MATWQHLRSSTANKRPTTSLADGRIAINTNTASPGLFFKDSAGTGIVKVGPVHVGTTAPNSVPASGGSSGNYTGEQWLDTSVSPAQMKVWNGSTWVGIVADELPVSKLQDGAARQLIQTDAAGTGVEWTSNVDVPGTLDVTSTATFDSIAQHPLGTAGAPTITFTGDTNTGIYSPGADQVAISTNGTGRLFVDANGQIGVNRASLSAYGIAVGPAAGQTIGLIGLIAGSTTNNSRIDFGDSAANDIGRITYEHSVDAMSFNVNGSERARIDSSGRLGLGTSSPSALLTVSAGEARIDLNATNASSRLWNLYSGGGGNIGAGAFAITEGGATPRFTIIGGGTGEAMRIDESNRVGVGTTGPEDHLTIAADNYRGLTLQTATSTNRPTVYFRNTGATAACFVQGLGQNLIFGRAPTSDYGSHTETARIDSSGRLGLGTSSATARMTVGDGNIYLTNSSASASQVREVFNYINPSASVSSSNGINFGFRQSDTFPGRGASIRMFQNGTSDGGGDASTAIGFWTYNLGSDNGVERMRLTGTGLGIGTTAPNSVLQVNSGTNLGGLLIGFNSGSSNFYDADLQVFRTGNGTERARIDSSGRLLVGTSSARSNFSGTDTPQFQVEGTTFNTSTISVASASSLGGGNIELAGTGTATVGNTGTVSNNGYLGSIHFLGGDGTNLRKGAAIDCQVDGTPGTNDMPGRLVFSTTADGAASPTERMRITNEGNVSIGTTGSEGRITIVGDNCGGYIGAITNQNNSNCNPAHGLIFRAGQNGSSSGSNFFSFRRPDDTVLGSISQNGASSVAYNTSSDYRLKENISPLTDAIYRISQLKPSQFNFITEPGKTVDGFIAHEAQEVVPECVTGDKDAVDDDGNPIYQGIDQSKLVPLLTAALQEALAEIESLKARVTALEP